MLNKLMPLGFGFVLAMALLPCQSYGDIVVGFSTDGGASFSNSETIASGSVLTVDVFLRDSDPNGVLVNEGLLGFGLVATLRPVDLGAIQNTLINSQFEFDPQDDSTGSSIDWEAATFGTPPAGTDILLGRFEFASSASGVATLEFSDKNPGSGSTQIDWLSGAGTELDETIFGTDSADSFVFAIETIAVPEPTSTWTMLIGGCLLISRRKRTLGK